MQSAWKLKTGIQINSTMLQREEKINFFSISFYNQKCTFPAYVLTDFFFNVV